jgi:endonuclease/exonuclease/phosphatase family metal-dependent hydrolase
MSYNIRCGQCDNNTQNSWDNRRELLLSVILKCNADVIGFQEMMPQQRDWLREKLPTYAVYGTGREADGGGEGCYIFYKRKAFKIDSTASSTQWFSSTPHIPGSADMGDLYKRILTTAHLESLTTGQKFYFFNTHLTYLAEIQPAYIKLLNTLIRERVANHEPFLLTGDFNADENSEAIKLLKQNFEAIPLIDTYRVIHPTGQLSTFNGFTGEQDGKKIDYIFADATHFKVLDADCIQTLFNGLYPSDHYPMTAKVKLKKLR